MKTRHLHQIKNGEKERKERMQDLPYLEIRLSLFLILGCLWIAKVEKYFVVYSEFDIKYVIIEKTLDNKKHFFEFNSILEMLTSFIKNDVHLININVM